MNVKIILFKYIKITNNKKNKNLTLQSILIKSIHYQISTSHNEISLNHSKIFFFFPHVNWKNRKQTDLKFS